MGRERDTIAMLSLKYSKMLCKNVLFILTIIIDIILFRRHIFDDVLQLCISSL